MLLQDVPIYYNPVFLKYMEQTDKYADNDLITWMWQQGHTWESE